MTSTNVTLSDMTTMLADLDAQRAQIKASAKAKAKAEHEAEIAVRKAERSAKFKAARDVKQAEHEKLKLERAAVREFDKTQREIAREMKRQEVKQEREAAAKEAAEKAAIKMKVILECRALLDGLNLTQKELLEVLA